MKPINRTIGILGLLASIMALSSLIYGASQEPLSPYMQGVMGGVMDVYRSMRNALFAGLGLTFSELINLIGKWLAWLPPAPWFSMPPIGMDIVTLYVIGANTTLHALVPEIIAEFRQEKKDREKLKEYLEKYNKKPPSRFFGNKLEYLNFAWNLLLIGMLWFWFVVMRLSGGLMGLRPNSFGDMTSLSYVRRWIFQLASTLGGSGVFFLLVYAENQIGL